jgi:hypothetical protein
MARNTSGATFITWLIAVALGVFGVLLRLHVIQLPWLAIDPFWFVTAGFGLLAAARFIKGL